MKHINLKRSGVLATLVIGSIIVGAIGGDAKAATIPGSTADAFITGTAAGGSLAIQNLGNDPLTIGRYTATQAAAAVFVFPLPALLSGETIDTASLTFTTVVNGSVQALTKDVDLYGLTYRTASTVVAASDFYVGALDTTDATLLKDDIFVAGNNINTATSYTTDTGANAALATYLNAQYTVGAVGGNYVFIRFNLEEFVNDQTGRFFIASTNNATESARPFITYTTVAVPEPRFLAIGSLALVPFMRARRQQM